jgi:hypothetical protein
LNRAERANQETAPPIGKPRFTFHCVSDVESAVLTHCEHAHHGSHRFDVIGVKLCATEGYEERLP